MGSVFVLVSAACGRSHPEPPLIRIIAHDFGYAMPARMPAGLVHLRLINQGPDIHEAMVIHFTAAGSAADYVDSVRVDVDFPAFGEDLGGTGLAAPGDSNDAYLYLAPGHYAMVCWKGDHLSRGMAQDFVVEADSTSMREGPSAALDADLSIVMTEYGYALSGPVSAGAHLIKVENHGSQPHEADIVRLGPGHTAREYIAWLDGGEHGLPPAEPIGGVGDFIGGRTVWMGVDLPPGHYLIICQVPDATDHKAHYEHGMIREFEVR